MHSISDPAAGRQRSGLAISCARGLAVAVVLLAVFPAAAQTGGIDVCTFDEQNQPLPGATATVSSNRQLTPTVSMLTGENGCASFPVLRAGGGYSVEIAMPGFVTYRFGDLRVPSGQTIMQRAVLLPAITERVEVSGRAALVDLDKTGGSTRFDDTFIEHLPVPGRFYQNILTLAPGVLDEDGDGNPNVHGARERNFRAVVDGVANTDPLTGEWISLLNADAIEEMEIVGTGAGVEFGRASGGFARIIQKQGSNEFEGLVSLIWRSSKLDGGVGDDLFTSPESAEFEWIQPAFQLSGPIVKDRLWYRLSHEWIDREDPIATLSGLVTTTRTQAVASDQLTWQMSPRNKLAVAYQADPTTIENFGVSSRVPPSASQRLERDGPTYKAKWTSPISPRLLVDTTIAHQDLERGFFPTAGGIQNACAVFGDFVGVPSMLNNARCFNPITGQYSGGHNETWEDRRQRLTVSTQVTWFTDKILGTSHRFKFGFTSENERFFRSLNRQPLIVFEVEDIPLSPDIARSNVRVSAPPNAANSATGNNWAVYIEDQFKPVSNLSVTLGLRYDREEIFSRGFEQLDPISEAAAFEQEVLETLPTSVSSLFLKYFTGFPDVLGFQADLAAALGIRRGDIPLGPLAVQSAFWPTTRQVDPIEIVNNNFSPRLSVAWDPWRDGKTKLSVTAGRYYDKIFLAVPLIDLEPPVAELEYLARENRTKGTFDNIGQLAFSPSVSIQTVDRDLRTPYQDELTISFEREIALETVIRATWIKRRFRDQIQDIDVNHQTGDKGRCVANADLRFPVVIPSLGEGFQYNDPFTGETITDTDPGFGDGIIDDCTGAAIRLNDIPPIRLRAAPDGLPDLYVMNPGWGEILEVGNYNTTDYEAWVLELVRRLYRNWQLALSYTWSEALGDAEDFDQVLGNERNLFEQERGFLAFDQSHVVKVNAMKTTRRGWQLGGALRWESGLPYSIIQSKPTLWSIPPLYSGNGDLARDFRFRYPSGARNDERNPSFWTLDLRVAREFRFKGANLRATIEAFNLLDDQTLVIDDRIDQTLGGSRRFGRQFQIGLRVGF
jgi:outer membrane receptor protein involved in Fe transport